MLLRSLAATVLLACPLAAAACSGNGSFDVAGPQGGVAESAWIDAVVEAECNQQMDCDCYVLAAPEGQDPTSYQLAQCKANRRAELENHVDQMKALGMHYDGGCVQTKLDALSRWGCADMGRAAVADGSYRSQANQCRVYYGEVAEGELCDISPYDNCGWGLACTQVSYDTVNGYDYERRCQRVLSKSEGQACDDDSNCAVGLLCSQQQVCRPMAKVGDVCSDSRCAPGGTCVYDASLPTCQPLLADGESCDYSGSSVCFGYCNIDQVCEPSNPVVCSMDFRRP